MTKPRSTFNAFAGRQKTQRNGHTIEIVYKRRGEKKPAELAGWYWRPAPFDELLDNERGPFISSRAAFRHACNVEN